MLQQVVLEALLDEVRTPHHLPLSLELQILEILSSMRKDRQHSMRKD